MNQGTSRWDIGVEFAEEQGQMKNFQGRAIKIIFAKSTAVNQPFQGSTSIILTFCYK